MSISTNVKKITAVIDLLTAKIHLVRALRIKIMLLSTMSLICFLSHLKIKVHMTVFVSLVIMEMVEHVFRLMPV